MCICYPQSDPTGVDAAVIETVMGAVGTMVEWTMSSVRQGLNWDDYSSSIVMNLIGSSLTAVGLLPNQADFQKEKALDLTRMMEDMMAALASTQVESEDPISIEIEKILIIGRRTRTATDESQITGSKMTLNPSLLTNEVSGGEEVLQITAIINQNPFTVADDVNTEIPSLSFKSVKTNQDIAIKNLPPEKHVKLFIFPDKDTSFSIDDGDLFGSVGYDPQQGIVYSDVALNAGGSKKIVVNVEDFAESSSLHIQILVSLNQTNTEVTGKSVTAYLGVNYEASRDRFEEKMDLFADIETAADHRTYTFFISDE